MRIYWPVSLLCCFYKLCKQARILSITEAFTPQKSVFYAGKVKNHMEDGFEKAVEAIFKGTPASEMLYATAGTVPKVQHDKAMSWCVAYFCASPL